jgi:RimJ/RimL family protein N-acetyltransferase
MEIPPYRVETPRLVIRCWQPADAELLDEAITESLEDLQQWMPWAHQEPKSMDERIQLLRTYRGQFDTGEDFVYGIFTSSETEVLGGAGLHTRLGDQGLEIGYWIRSSAAGRGLATEASAALTRAAFTQCGVDRVEIHVDPANAKSVRIPEKLGFTREAHLRRRLPPLIEGGPRADMVVYCMFVDEFGASPVAKTQIAAFDSANRLLV